MVMKITFATLCVTRVPYEMNKIPFYDLYIFEINFNKNETLFLRMSVENNFLFFSILSGVIFWSCLNLFYF
jgi:hypothetical protein